MKMGKFQKQRMIDSAHSLHAMYMTLRTRDEASADEWLNGLDSPKRKLLEQYWNRNGFSYLVQNIGIMDGGR